MRYCNPFNRLILAVLLVPAVVAVAEPPQANLALWLDAGDIDGDGQTDDNPANGTPIGEGGNPWVNKATGLGVGNAVTATEEGGDAPLYVSDAGSSLGNHPAVAFDGNSSGLKVADDDDLDATQGLTVFVVALDATNGFRFAQKGNGGGTGTGDWFLSQSSGLGVGGTFQSPPYSKPAGAHIFESVFDPTSGTHGRLIALLDGASRGLDVLLTASYSGPNSDPLYIGRRNNPGGSQGWLGGQIAEILLYTSTLGVAERNTVGQYLMNKYGISGTYTAATLAYADVVIGDYPVAYWRFEDADTSNGQVAANQGSSGSVNNGVYNGGVTTTSSFSKKLGKAAVFNGSSTYVDLDFDLRDALNGASAVTIEAWVLNDMLPGDDPNNVGYFIMGNYIEANQTGVRLSIESAEPRMNLAGRSSSADPFRVGGRNYGDSGRWRHVVGVMDYADDRIDVYIDGERTSTAVSFSAVTYSAGVTDSLRDTIGCRDAGTAFERFFDGMIDEVAVYAYDLGDPNGDGDTSDSRVSAHYAAGLPSAPAGTAVIIQ